MQNAGFKVQINMADVIVTIEIMPESPDVNLELIKQEAVNYAFSFSKLQNKEQINVKVEPVAFGLNVIKLTFFMPESIGSTEPLEAKIKSIKGVNSAETTDVRRAMG